MGPSHHPGRGAHAIQGLFEYVHRALCYLKHIDRKAGISLSGTTIAHVSDLDAMIGSQDCRCARAWHK